MAVGALAACFAKLHRDAASPDTLGTRQTAIGIVLDTGPLVSGGGLTYVLYLLVAVWQIAVTTVIVVRLGKSTRDHV